MKKTISITLMIFFALGAVVKADTNAILKKQRAVIEEQRRKENKEKLQVRRANEIVNMIISIIEELKREGVKFGQAFPRDPQYGTYKLGGKVAIESCYPPVIGWWEVTFRPIGGSSITIEVKIPSEDENTIRVLRKYGDNIFECSIDSDKCIVSHRKELKSAIIKLIESSTGD